MPILAIQRVFRNQEFTYSFHPLTDFKVEQIPSEITQPLYLVIFTPDLLINMRMSFGIR
jgi:hypothetical protein